MWGGDGGRERERRERRRGDGAREMHRCCGGPACVCVVCAHDTRLNLVRGAVLSDLATRCGACGRCFYGRYNVLKRLFITGRGSLSHSHVEHAPRLTQKHAHCWRLWRNDTRQARLTRRRICAPGARPASCRRHTTLNTRAELAPHISPSVSLSLSPLSFSLSLSSRSQTKERERVAFNVKTAAPPLPGPLSPPPLSSPPLNS